MERYIVHKPECENNLKGSSSAMEADGALALFERSARKLNLMYEKDIGDGDFIFTCIGSMSLQTDRINRKRGIHLSYNQMNGKWPYCAEK